MAAHDAIAPAPFEAVVIGASAGGVEALHAILSALPAHFRAAVLVVLHLPPRRASTLASLYGARCALPVADALDKQPVRAGEVLIAPPDYHLMVEPDRHVALSVDEPVLFSRPAIDPLFESAAVAWGDRLLAIVLTGGSADGSRGLAEVRRRKGTAWVQDPASAVAATMPAAALALAGADEILSISQISQRLAGAFSP